MSDVLMKLLIITPFLIILVYAGINLTQVWKDRAYESFLVKQFRDAKQWGYDEAVRHLEQKYAHSLKEIKNDITEKLLKSYGDSAEFIFEKDHSICIRTGAVTKAKYFRYKPTYVTLAIKPTKEFVAKMDYYMEVGHVVGVK